MLKRKTRKNRDRKMDPIMESAPLLLVFPGLKPEMELGSFFYRLFLLQGFDLSKPNTQFWKYGYSMILVIYNGGNDESSQP
jgi:hypothetical protein